MYKFKVGDKVKIVEGGWGIHPTFVGKLGTIRGISGSGRYSLVEDLISSSPDVSHISGHFFGVESFELVEEVETTELIREVNRAIYKNKQDLEELLMKREALLDQLMGELQ